MGPIGLTVLVLLTAHAAILTDARLKRRDPRPSTSRVAFQSDALLVPERCVFDHVHNKSVCENQDHWKRSASDNCRSKNMNLQSFGMLQPCGSHVFSGVEFVCCPSGSGSDASTSTSRSSPSVKSGDQSEGNSFAQAANGMISDLSKGQPKYETEENNEIKTEHDSGKHSHDDSSSDDNSGNEEDEYDEDADEDSYDDDSTEWKNAEKSPSTTSTTTTTTTTTSTTTTTERPIERYMSHFDLAHEHDDFRRAEAAVETSYQDKITEVMREWSRLDGRYEEMKQKGELEAAEEFKRKMTHEFQTTLEALQKESAAQRHRLVSMHAQRAMTIINRRKKAAMDCLTQALDRVPIHTRQVERCIVRLLKALERDRSHTLRQYKNLLRINTHEALKERSVILEHLMTLNRAANQSIAMLDRSPKLVEKLKTRIVSLWHELRGIPQSESIAPKSEEKILDQYEEEVARQKIDRERKRLAEHESNQSERLEPSNKVEVAKSSRVMEISTQKSDTNGAISQPDQRATSFNTAESQDLSLSPVNKPVNTVATESSTSTTNQPLQFVDAVSELQTGSSPSQPKQSSSSPVVVGVKNERAHYQAQSANFAHLRADGTHHEFSYSIRHEPIHGHLKFGYSAALVSSFAAIILLAFIGVKYYGKSSNRAYRRQGFAEVGRTCPEERKVTQMQFNGYENPAYKYFGAEA